MNYIETCSTDPTFNLAAEQFVFENMDKSQEYFMLWQNAKSIIIGKNQNTFFEINHKFVMENGIQVVRRLSGGGAVYHDLGNLNFTYIVNDDNNFNIINLHYFCEPILKVLCKIGINAEISSRNDITIQGKKISGNAQYKRDGRVMHHGTIMFDVNIENLVKALAGSEGKNISKGIKSVKSRVANIKEYLSEDIDINSFKYMLLNNLFPHGIPQYIFSDKDIKSIKELQRTRYATYGWNYGSPLSDAITYKKGKIDGCGTIEVALLVENNIITFIKFYGDFFGNNDVDELSVLLTGHGYNYDEIIAVLQKYPLECYFHNIPSALELSEILFK